MDAQLASTLIKQEIPRPPEGRKTACRAVIAFAKGRDEIAVVLHVYAKSEKTNLTPRETEALGDLSQRVLKLSPREIERLIAERGWKEIKDGEQE